MKYLKLSIIMTLFITLSSCAKKKDPVIFHVSDLHYLSESLHDNGPMFQYLMKSGDGKISEHSVEVLERIIEVTIEEQPDALIISGDLTFNGEAMSLSEVKEGLMKIKEAGIPVLVIPGNHDIEYPYAARYEGTEAKQTEGITQSLFKDTMKEFGYENALSQDPSSFSYVYEVKEDLWLMGIDTNTTDHECVVLSDTLLWMEEMLKNAKENNIRVMTFTHQNVLKQSEIVNGYLITNAQSVVSLLKKYDVALNLSGHSHLQHISCDENLTDICGESIALYPLQYGVVTFDTNQNMFDYENRKLGILENDAYERFEETSMAQVFKMTAEMDIPIEDRMEISEFAAEFDIAVFSGDHEKLMTLKEENGWKLWKKYLSDQRRFAYMKGVIEEIGKDHEE